jgi:hypothetical protein
LLSPGELCPEPELEEVDVPPGTDDPELPPEPVPPDWLPPPDCDEDELDDEEDDPGA